MNKQQIEDILLRFKQGRCSEDELDFLEDWFVHWNENELLGLSEQELNQELDQITKNVFVAEVKPIKLWRAVAAAAVILIVSAFSYLMLVKNLHNGASNNYQVADILPGDSKAVLTLSNGKKILLNHTKNGTIANEALATVNKTKDDLITYFGANQPASNKQTVFNTLNVPAGGHFHIILSDGTGVWLNSLSSIKFPVVFAGNERKVEITGEAYFEVVHNAKKPFKVLAEGHLVEDIGTHFNVNCYKDEASVNTTLLSGSVKVYSGYQNQVLKPGQQSQIGTGGNNTAIKVVDANIDEVIGWKDGFFRFRNTNITEVMKQVSRWYNVDIRYEGDVSNKEFSGVISRGVTISRLLEMLRFFNINLKIENHNGRNELIVSPAETNHKTT